MAPEYDALYALVSVFASGDYATNSQLFQDTDNPPALMLQLLQHTFEHEPAKKKNFLRGLTHDNCHDRHAILEPDLLEEACPLDNGQHHSPSSTIPASLFDKLPLEILRQIFVEDLDLESLTMFRSMGSRLRSAIDQLPEYQEIVQHAPASIRAALSLRVASTMTCRDLYTALCTKTCSTCPEFGAYLYLPTCQRACLACFTKKDEYLPLAVNHAKVHWDISLSDIASSATIIQALPGVYRTCYHAKTKTKTALVHKASVLEVAERVHISLEEAATSREEKMTKWENELAKWNKTPADKRKAKPMRPQHCVPADDKFGYNPHRFMCIVGFPWLNKSSEKAEWGIACTGCHCCLHSAEDSRGQGSRIGLWENAKRLHTEDEFLAHFVECRHARRVFLERFGKINGDEMFLKSRQVCDVAGDLDAVKKTKDAVGHPRKPRLDRIFWQNVQKHIDARTEWERGFAAL